MLHMVSLKFYELLHQYANNLYILAVFKLIVLKYQNNFKEGVLLPLLYSCSNSLISNSALSRSGFCFFRQTKYPIKPEIVITGM